MSGATRSLTDLFSIFGGRRASVPDGAASDADCRRTSRAYPTKALAKFLKLLKARENPALIDLGPVVGSQRHVLRRTAGVPDSRRRRRRRHRSPREGGQAR